MQRIASVSARTWHETHGVAPVEPPPDAESRCADGIVGDMSRRFRAPDRGASARQRQFKVMAAAVAEAKELAEYHEFPGANGIRPHRGNAGHRWQDRNVRIFALSRKISPQATAGSSTRSLADRKCLLWQLDVSFGEDAARNHKDNGPANIAVIRCRALDVARRDKSKGSLTEKLK